MSILVTISKLSLKNFFSLKIRFNQPKKWFLRDYFLKRCWTKLSPCSFLTDKSQRLMEHTVADMDILDMSQTQQQTGADDGKGIRPLADKGRAEGRQTDFSTYESCMGRGVGGSNVGQTHFE